MTYAPKTLLEARHVIQEYTGLSDVEVGIVGDPAHNGGYHQGWDKRRLVNGVLRDYSWQESPRDWNHVTNAASAIDIGWFDQLVDGTKVNLIDFNKWMVQELNAGAPDTLDIREFIYTPDGKVVKRWDRLKRRSTGDPSHLLHSHISRFRDAENNPIAPLFRRFFEGVTVAINETDFQALIWRVEAIIANRKEVAGGPVEGEDNKLSAEITEIKAQVAELKETTDLILAKLDTISDGPIPDSITITSGVLNLGTATQ